MSRTTAPSSPWRPTKWQRARFRPRYPAAAPISHPDGRRSGALPQTTGPAKANRRTCLDAAAPQRVSNEPRVGLTLFARIWLTAQDEQTVERFTEVIRQVPQVLECHLMAGDSDFLLRVVAKDLDDYRRFQIAHLTRSNGVQSIKTDIPMERIKQSSELPL